MSALTPPASVVDVSLPKAEIRMTASELRDWMDACIRRWRGHKADAEYSGDRERMDQAAHYVDAFQSVRSTIFGATLPVES